MLIDRSNGGGFPEGSRFFIVKKQSSSVVSTKTLHGLPLFTLTQTLCSALISVLSCRDNCGSSNGNDCFGDDLSNPG
jgi:hypothetical protein